LGQLIHEGPNKVLDVGCGEGRTGAALKAGGQAGEVVGVEKNAAVAKIAEGLLDGVICGDVEHVGLPFAPGYFDYIVLGDVLEHLVDPWAVVGRLARLLRTQGHMIASIPNVRHWRVMLPLIIQGEWTYSEEGVLDDTHLRFFTRKSMQGLFPGPALVVKQVVPELRFLPTSRACWVNRLTFHLFEDFLTVRYVVEVEKA
jgi:2-polyprenyl-3-methyl-5-hydroxy-6-metoxy-1,4-benzoquinol methylase